MLHAFLKMLPFLWAGMILPTWTSRVILLLGTDHPVLNSASYIGGNAVYRFILGLGLLFLFSSRAVQDFLASIPPLPSIVWLALGAGLVAIAIWSMTRAASTAGEASGLLRAYERLSPWLVFALGFIAVASPGIQYVYFAGGVGAITSENLPDYQEIILLAVYVLLLQTMLVIPVVVYYRYRDRADRIFDSMKDWLSRRGGVLIGAILMVFGIACLIQAWRTWGGPV